VEEDHAIDRVDLLAIHAPDPAPERRPPAH
jgi:hypothetical protein